VREPRKCKGLADVKNFFPVNLVPEQWIFGRFWWRTVGRSQRLWWDVRVKVSRIFWVLQLRAIWSRVAVYIFPIYTPEPRMRLQAQTSAAQCERRLE